MAQIIKRTTKPKPIVVIGGPHCDEVCFNHLETKVNPNNPLLKNNLFDFVVSGDGEYMLLSLMRMIVEGMEKITAEKQITLDDVGEGEVDEAKKYVLEREEEFKKVEGRARIHFKVAEKSYHFSSLDEDIDLNKLKPLRYEYLKKEHFYDFPIFNKEINGQTRVQKCVQVMTHRGCGGRCNFCSERVPLYGMDSYYNEIEVEKVISDLQHYVHRFGVEAIFFDDSTFMERKGYVEKLCSQIVNSGLPKLKWGCLNRFDKVKDDKLVMTMKKAGLDYMYLGLEIKDDNALRLMRKSTKKVEPKPSEALDTDVIEKTLEILCKHKVRVGVSILFGYPGVSEGKEKETIEWVGDMVKKGMIELVSLSLFNYHEASKLSELDAEVIDLNYFDVEDKIEKQNASPWNCFEEGGWYHDESVNPDYLGRLLWRVDHEIARAHPPDQTTDKSVLVRKEQLEKFMESEWGQALRDEEIAFKFIQGKNKIALPWYTVVGNYVADGEHLNTAKELYNEILGDLENKSPKSFYLVWGPSRRGKSFLLTEIGRSIREKQLLYQDFDLSVISSYESFMGRLSKSARESRDRPTLIFIDEITSRPEWPFTAIKTLMDKMEQEHLPVTLVLAGSYGNSVDELEDYLESQNKNQGTDMIKRTKGFLKKYSLPDHTVQGRIVIALSCIKQVGKTAGREMKSVEKSALYRVALTPHLKDAGVIKNYVTKAIQLHKRRDIKYQDMFQNDQEKEEFERILKDKLGDIDHLLSLHGSILKI